MRNKEKVIEFLNNNRGYITTSEFLSLGISKPLIKKFLNDVLQDRLRPIRERREEYAKDPEAVYEMLKEGTIKARKKAKATLDEVKRNMGLNYFS